MPTFRILRAELTAPSHDEREATRQMRHLTARLARSLALAFEYLGDPDLIREARAALEDAKREGLLPP